MPKFCKERAMNFKWSIIFLHLLWVRKIHTIFWMALIFGTRIFSAFQHYSLLSFLLPFFLVALEGQRSIFDLLEWPQTTLTCYKSSKNVENSSGARRNQNKNCKIQTLFPLDDSNKNEERVVARAHFLLLLTWAEFLLGL